MSDSKNRPNSDQRFESTRRQFIRTTALIASSAALVPLAANAQDNPAMLSEDDPTAIALGYRADATTVDLNKYPSKASDQLCSNCSLYASSGDGVGKCAAVPSRLVAGAGWCGAWNLAR